MNSFGHSAEALLALVTGLRAQIQRSPGLSAGPFSDEALAMIESLAKDAERYRWLRSGRSFELAGLFVGVQTPNGITRGTMTYADSLIDSAMHAVIEGKAER